MAHYYKNLTGSTINVEIFGHGMVNIPADAASVELPPSVARSINTMAKPTVVLEETFPKFEKETTPVVDFDAMLEAETSIDYNELPKAALKALLDDRGIKYHRDAPKAELLDLLGVGGEDVE